MPARRSAPRRRGAIATQVAALMMGAGALATACVDESHDLQVQALSGEVPGIAPGPLHRPGQPCLTCHGEAGPSSHQFVMAGTVFAVKGESDPAAEAQVVIEDVTGSFFAATTNAAGNFYIPVGEWSPTTPLTVQVPKAGLQMMSLIGRAGSCADCHTLTSGPTSPGPVYLARPMEGGAP
jgi:hypothetical protein